MARMVVDLPWAQPDLEGAALGRDLLPSNQLFASLDASELLDLTQRTRLYTVEAGDILTREGQPVTDVYFIRKGRAKAELSAARNDTPTAVVSFLLGPGSDVGLISVLDGEPHAVTVRAVDDLLVSAVPLWAMAHLLQRQPERRAILAHLTVSSLRVRGGWIEKSP